MYNQRRSRAPIVLLVLAGVIVAIVFLVISNTSDSPQDEETTTLDDSSEASPSSGFLQVAISPTEQPTPIQEIENTESTDQVNATESDEIASAAPLSNDIEGDATIFIPSASIYAPIVRVYLDGTSWDVSRLGANIGHLEGTSWLDEGGNVVLSGHVELSDGRRGIFANLEEVNIGDFVILEHDNIEYRYVVTNTYTTAPTDLTPIYPTDKDRLTLITCDNYDFFQDSYLDRTIIVADRLS